MPKSRPPLPGRTRTAWAMVLLTLLPAALCAQQQEEPARLTRILFVVDASNSMNAFWGNEPRITVARRVLLEALTPLEKVPDLELALRLYGHQTR
ncbi:MAG: hypothetical protein KBF80_10345, partial [Flavobacteriales bacterium]|nr:hypothetical protein [Flavobacteriales bacterium]